MNTTKPAIMSTQEWFRRAMPSPNRKNFHVQLGVHVEEFSEMLVTINGADSASAKLIADALDAAKALATGLKTGVVQISDVNWVEFFDGVMDQRVTGIGLAYIIGADVDGGIDEVDSSNESKYVDGQPVWDANGKIAKGPDYRRANLLPYLPATITILDK